MLLAALFLQAAPVPDGTTLVFFDWGESEISRDAAATLDAFAAANGDAPILVTGHSDRSGPASANQRSSLERARMVADYLAGKGIPRSAMTVTGAGEEQPLIATEDGVREVQNRRVEIRRR